MHIITTSLLLVIASQILVSAEEWRANKKPQLIPAEMFEIDPSLEVKVWATTPMLYNPTNMDIDHKGRCWVTEGVNYRGRNGTRPNGDRIVVLQDTDGDGQCDSSHTFVQEKGLIAPMGIAVFDNVVYLSQPPDLIAYTDVNRNLVFEPEIDKREVILTGFNAINHDHSLHSLTAGPDGKFYFNNGNCGAVFTDKSGKTFYMGGTYGGSGPNWPAEHLKNSGRESGDGHVWTSGFAVRMDSDGSNAEIVSHGLRNSYEQTLTSFGDMFQNDNDDPRACRTSYALEFGCAGYFTRDAMQRNKAVRRPGQSYASVHWRQDDPGTMDAGDVYGGGSPTGITFYENGALGQNWEGMLLSCEAALNTIFGYKPVPKGGTFELKRFVFLTSNPNKEYDGADFSGRKDIKQGDERNISPTFFRPSDVTVGADGAIYFADWFDPRIGASSHLDESFSGTIYRVAPKGFKPNNPEINLSRTEGQINALRSPAINTRYLGFRALKEEKNKSFKHLSKQLDDGNQWIAARAVWLLPYAGKAGLDTCIAMLKSENSQKRVVAYRALRRAGHDMIPHARRMCRDQSPQVRREIALSLRDIPAERTKDIFVELAKLCDTNDKNSLEAIGLGAAKQESVIWSTIKNEINPASSKEWSDHFAKLTWRLWGAASVADLKSRITDNSLSLEKRKFALESLAFIDDKVASDAMLEIAAEPSEIKGQAVAWLLRNATGEWAKHGVNEGLKEKGIYDPDAIAIIPSPIPTTPDNINATVPKVKEILKLEGNPLRGQNQALRCIICHQIDGKGVDYGPNLKGWASNQSLEATIRAIAEPSAGIALGYNGTEIILKDGGIIHGITYNNSDPWIKNAPPLIIQSAGGVTQFIPNKRIDKKRPLDRSLMYDPTFLGLSAQDIADIARWLKDYK